MELDPFVIHYDAITTKCFILALVTYIVATALVHAVVREVAAD